MAIRRVFVIWAHPLFHASIRLLLSHPEVEWVGAAADPEAAREQIATARPDTIVIEERGGALATEALEVLQACPWQVRVIGLSLADNRMSVYQHAEHVVGQAEDLLSLILA